MEHLQCVALGWAMLSPAWPCLRITHAYRMRADLSQTIFLLEDDVDISRLVQYHLQGAGFQVKPYMTMGTIVADAEREPPAVFLLDIMVPGGGWPRPLP